MLSAQTARETNPFNFGESSVARGAHWRVKTGKLNLVELKVKAGILDGQFIGVYRPDWKCRINSDFRTEDEGRDGQPVEILGHPHEPGRTAWESRTLHMIVLDTQWTALGFWKTASRIPRRNSRSWGFFHQDDISVQTWIPQVNIIVATASHNGWVTKSGIKKLSPSSKPRRVRQFAIVYGAWTPIGSARPCAGRWWWGSSPVQLGS